MLRFISNNPVTQAMDENENRQRDRMREERLQNQDVRADQQYQNDVQARADQKRSEEATRVYQGSQIPEDNANLRTLSQTPGTSAVVGQEIDRARQAKITQDEEHDKAEKLAVQALASGDDVTYQYWKQKAPGLTIPPEIENNAKSKSLYGKGMLVAEKLYKDDPEQAHRFVTSFMQNGGNLDQALSATGVPRTKLNLSPAKILQDGKSILAMYDQYGQVHVPKDAQGNAYDTAQKSGSVPANIQEIEYLKTLGMTPEEARDTVYNSGWNPQKAQADIYTKIYKSLMDDFSNPRTPEQAHTEALAQSQRAIAALSQKTQPQTQSQPQTPNPQTVSDGPPMGPDGKVDYQNIPVGTVYTVQGKGQYQYIGNGQFKKVAN